MCPFCVVYLIYILDMSTTDAYSLSFFFHMFQNSQRACYVFLSSRFRTMKTNFYPSLFWTDRDAEPRSGRRYPHQQSVDIRYPQQHTAALEHNYHQLVDILDNDFKQPLSPRFLWASVTYSTKLCYGSFVNWHCNLELVETHENSLNHNKPCLRPI